MVEVSTRGVPARDRDEYWRQVLCAAFVPVEVSRRDRSASVHGSALTHGLGQVWAARVSSSAQVIRRTPRLIARSDTADLLHVAVSRRGTGCLRQDGREVEMRPGTVVVYETARPFTVEWGPGWEAVTLTVPRASIPLSSGETSRLTARGLPAGYGLGSVVSRAVEDLAVHAEQLPESLAPRLVGDLTDLTLALLQEQGTCTAPAVEGGGFGDGSPPQGGADALAQVKHYVDDRLGDPGLSPAQVATANHLSLRALYKLFDGHPVSVSGYIRERRLIRVAAALRDPQDGELPVAVLARRAGFADLSGFRRAFRARYGMTPSQFREPDPRRR